MSDYNDDPVPLIVKSYLSKDGKHRIMDCPFCEEKFLRPVVGRVTPELIDVMRTMQERFREHLEIHYKEEEEE